MRHVLWVALVVMTTAPVGAAPVLHGLGGGASGDSSSSLLWVSEEGVAGGSVRFLNEAGSEITEGVLLDPSGNRIPVGELIDGGFSFSVITAGTRDGSRVAGRIAGGPISGARGFSSASEAGLVVLPTRDVPSPLDWVHDVSAAGDRIVGTATGQAVVWDHDHGIVNLGSLDPVGRESYGYGISADGSSVVGKARNAFGRIEAFQWRAETGMVGLGGLLPRDAANFVSEADKISADGSTIVGWTNSPFGAIPFKWTEAEGMRSIGTLPGLLAGFVVSDAYYDIDVSGDGSIVVGTSFTTSGAYIHTEPAGLQSLEDHLVALGLDLGGWQLSRASGISENGRFIVGTGVNPAGELEGYLVVVPEPSTSVLLFLGIALLSGTRRAH